MLTQCNGRKWPAPMHTATHQKDHQYFSSQTQIIQKPQQLAHFSFLFFNPYFKGVFKPVVHFTLVQKSVNNLLNLGRLSFGFFSHRMKLPCEPKCITLLILVRCVWGRNKNINTGKRSSRQMWPRTDLPSFSGWLLQTVDFTPLHLSSIDVLREMRTPTPLSFTSKFS